MRASILFAAFVPASAASILLYGCWTDASFCVGSACSDSGGDATIADAPSSLTDGGMGSDTSVVLDVPDGCVLADEPSASPSCIDKSVGVFVSPNGSDSTGDGTDKAPYATITKALTSGLPRLYICSGTYGENVSMNASNEKELFGGFTCENNIWTYSAAVSTVTVSPNTGYPLRIDSTTTPLRIEDISFTAAPGTALAPNSIAAFLINGAPVTFVRDFLAAGPGFPGSDGVTGSNYDAGIGANDPAIAGNASTGLAGGGQHKCELCVDNSISVGGFGGNGGTSPGAGQDGGPFIPGAEAGKGAGGTVVDCQAGLGGRRGADGVAAAPASGALVTGTLTDAGWFPSPGLPGENGGVAQGGGGGGGGAVTANNAGGGGGGGCGGCGGAGATPGSGGGASIAAIALSTVINFSNCTISTSSGGAGGSGSAGQPGQGGGTFANGSAPGCTGGSGGSGGSGAASGGGAGGLSVGIIFDVKAPSLDMSTVKSTRLGDAGSSGLGGIPLSNDGVAGVSMVTYSPAIADASTR